MKHAALLFAVSLALVAAPSFADDTTSRADAKTSPAVAAGKTVAAQGDLGRIASTAARPVSNAGAGREVAPPTVNSSPVVRPVATPRLLRRMNADRVQKDLETRAQTCAENVAVKTSVVLRLSVAPGGEVEGINGVAGTGATEQIVACVWSAARAMTFIAPGSEVDVDLAIAITPTARAAAVTPPKK